MTPGHKHRTIRLRKRNGLIHRALTKPLVISTNLQRVVESPYPWGPVGGTMPAKDADFPNTPRVDKWQLSTLSILHRWTGLTLWVPDQ